MTGLLRSTASWLNPPNVLEDDKADTDAVADANVELAVVVVVAVVGGTEDFAGFDDDIDLLVTGSPCPNFRPVIIMSHRNVRTSA